MAPHGPRCGAGAGASSEPSSSSPVTVSSLGPLGEAKDSGKLKWFRCTRNVLSVTFVQPESHLTEPCEACESSSSGRRAGSGSEAPAAKLVSWDKEFQGDPDSAESGQLVAGMLPKLKK